jgi:cysteine synthase
LQTVGEVDAFCCAMGTGGTLAGVGAALRAASGGRVVVALTDPEGAALVRWFNGPGRLGAVYRPQRFPMKIHFVWSFCMGAQGA